MLRARARGEDLVLRTSGSAGRPRTVVRSSESWWSSFESYTELTGVGRGARVWVPGPPGSTMNLFAAVHADQVGAALVATPAEATHACLTPAALERRAAELAPGTRVVVAGAALSAALHRQATSRGLQVVHYYGAAELSFVAAGPHVDELRPFPGVEVRIREREIQVRSPYVARNLPEWAGVGDLGRLEDGRLVVLGRPGSVTTAGATVAIADVEAALRPVAGGQFVVLGVPHPALGELLCAVVTSETDREALAREARRSLPPSHRPRAWRVLDRLPLTPAGKVDRVGLAERFPDLPAGVR